MNTVDELAGEYGTSEPFELAERMGINVFRRPLADIGGYYALLRNGMKIAVIDSTLPRHLQRFVLAHEIGHAVLHPEQNAMMLKSLLWATDRQEIEADRFAVNLLLSDSMVYDNPDRTVDDWASILGLPRKVVELKFRG